MNGKAAAFVRALFREGGKNEISSRLQGAAHYFQVSPDLHRFGKEMEDRPVIPERISAYRLKIQTIRCNPMKLSCKRPQPSPSPIQGCLGNIKHRNISMSHLQEIIRQQTISPSDIDQRGRGFQTEFGNPLKCLNWPGLIPANQFSRFCAVNVIPMGFSTTRLHAHPHSKRIRQMYKGKRKNNREVIRYGCGT